MVQPTILADVLESTKESANNVSVVSLHWSQFRGEKATSLPLCDQYSDVVKFYTKAVLNRWNALTKKA